jgi:cobalt-zinc-cadmium efflux system outer membrane protein
MAIRLGVMRSEKDVKLARANAYPDVYVLYQPYTFQNNTYLGVPSAYSWTLGVTASVPLYNRNQGNIRRAKLNVVQTQIQAASVERGVVSDVLNAAREYEQSRLSVIEMRKEIVPASREVRNTAYRRWQGGETNAIEYLSAQQDFNDVVRQYRDALVRYRQAMLDLNTAVSERVVP